MQAMSDWSKEMITELANSAFGVKAAYPTLEASPTTCMYSVLQNQLSAIDLVYFSQAVQYARLCYL